VSDILFEHGIETKAREARDKENFKLISSLDNEIAAAQYDIVEDKKRELR
jgi:hypothetical protein